MILYQDTSSILKRYLNDTFEQPGSRDVTSAAVEASDFIATAIIAFAETSSVLARARRGRRIRTNAAYLRARDDFLEQWDGYIKIEVDAGVVGAAGSLAELHFLKGYDAVHLAAALALKQRVPDAIQLSTWDKDLAAAATAEGLSLAHEVTT